MIATLCGALQPAADRGGCLRVHNTRLRWTRFPALVWRVEPLSGMVGSMMRAGGTRMGFRRRSASMLLACLAVGACEQGTQAFNPAAIWREVSGANDAARPAPPGLDQPFPSLGSVPPRPERPSPEVRDAITAALTADRSRSREPVALRTAPGGGASTAGGMAAGPPPRPALAAAPPVPWVEAPRVRSGGGAVPSAAPSTAPVAGPVPSTRTGAASPASAPAPAPAPLPEVPDAAPALPPPDLLGAPPPPPSPDLLAPSPPAAPQRR